MDTATANQRPMGLADDEDEGQGPMTRAERREAQTVRILDAAKKCFVRSGFQGASMHDICKEAEMSPGALYRYFPSKEAIIEAIAEADRTKDAALLAEALANPDIVEGIVQAMMTHLRVSHENNMAPLFTEIRAEALRNPSVLETCECSMRQVHELIFRRIQAAIAAGQIRPAVSVETLMAVMVSIGEGIVLNDLPAKGINLDEVEHMVRTSVTANLRPVAQ
ncbi:MAG: TetR/AcrR family transcriptional regulator [Zhengella sp.]|uniref:TetR/AcrR family transcriptional regulator n=1 Tax=Zhengella sp. TaxID=2282762 RepID=UPI001E07CD13|nr:TetR/AcrR family transcriptional regulator [Notoacmeibacter sp.]MCC0026586.1 TetR/AcrR family transcriptional regulator [Brucellaceae bacterium]